MTIAEEQTETKQPINVKQAVRAAIQYVHELYSDDQVFDVSLEEVERGTYGEWYITIGFTRKVAVPISRTAQPSGITGLPSLADIVRANATAASVSVEREYKIIQVDAETGMPVSMKIRKP